MNRLSNFIKRVAWRCLHPLVLRFSPCEWRSIDDLPPQGDEDKEWKTRCVVVWQDAEHASDQGVEVTNLAQIRDGDFHQERYQTPVWRTVMDAPIYAQNTAGQDRREATYPEPAGSASPVTQPPRDVSELYHELLYAVARKFPGESRHETALRYIRDTEERVCETGSCKQNNPI